MNGLRDYFDASTSAIESFIKARTLEFDAIDLPLNRADRRQDQQAQRQNDQRAMQDQRRLADLRHELERIDAEIRSLAARQRLAAQHDLGFAIEWRKRGVELLDTELGIAERRAVLREQTGLRDDYRNGSDVEELLYEIRAEMQANGLDTTRLEEELARLRGRRDR
jgi:hypothetical protein